MLPNAFYLAMNVNLFLRRQIKSHCFMLEVAFVRPIAKGFVARQATAADTYQRSPPQVVRGAGFIDDLEVALYFYGAVAKDGKFGGCHEK